MPDHHLGFRIGHGYDLHRLATPENGGRPLVLGGVLLQHDRGPVAHSDGDALYHAVTDALLGAIGNDDIGQLFPDNHPDNDGRDSADFVRAAVERVRAAGLCVANLDATVIIERPKLGPVKPTIRANLARLLGVHPNCANVKGKTREGLDALGHNPTVEAHCVVLLGQIRTESVEFDHPK